jgi:competence protein ComEC
MSRRGEAASGAAPAGAPPGPQPAGPALPGSGFTAASSLTDRKPPDLRLVAVAVATWLSSLAALQTRAPVALAGAGVAVAATLVVWRWVRRPGAWAGIAAALLLGVVCGATATAARLTARDAAPVAQAAETRAEVTVLLEVRRDPRLLGRDLSRPASWLIPVWLERIDDGRAPPVRVRARMLVLAGDPQWQELRPGQRLVATGRLGPPRGDDLTAAVLSANGAPRLVGEPPWVQRAAAGLRDGLREATDPLPDLPGGLIPGVAVGDVSELDPGLRDDFFATGMTHLVAVSGTHCAIVVGFVFLLARSCRAPPWLVAVVSLSAVVGYVILCQATPSVVRAGVMGTVALLALASGRPRAAMPALGATVTVLVVVDPQLAGTPGFALSVVATGGLLLLAPGWRDALRRLGVPAGLAEALAIPAAAQLAVSPIIAGMSGTVSLVAVVANLVATPVMVPATLLGVIAAVASAVWSPAAEFLAWLASWPAWWLVLVARHGAQAPAAVVPWPAGWTGGLLLAVLTVAMLVAARHRLVRRLVAVVAAAAVAGALPVALLAGGWPPAGAVVVTCAVGQGDLVVVPVRSGTAVVVDAGPEPAVADRCLRDLGVRSVPLFVVSHYHLDHVGGVAGVFRGRQVTAVLAPPFPEPERGQDLVAAATAGAGVPVGVARAGTVYEVGEVTLRVLGPMSVMAGTRSDPNNNSVVIMAEVRGVRVLLTGDAEVEQQQELLERVGPAGLRADVLKTPHHGSGYQDEAFLAAVAPAVALVPVGADNSYGHPHPELIAGWERHGIRVLRTDIDGDVAAVLLDGRLAVVARAPPPVPAP